MIHHTHLKQKKDTVFAHHLKRNQQDPPNLIKSKNWITYAPYTINRKQHRLNIKQIIFDIIISISVNDKSYKLSDLFTHLVLSVIWKSTYGNPHFIYREYFMKKFTHKSTKKAQETKELEIGI